MTVNLHVIHKEINLTTRLIDIGSSWHGQIILSCIMYMLGRVSWLMLHEYIKKEASKCSEILFSNRIRRF